MVLKDLLVVCHFLVQLLMPFSIPLLISELALAQNDTPSVPVSEQRLFQRAHTNSDPYISPGVKANVAHTLADELRAANLSGGVIVNFAEGKNPNPEHVIVFIHGLWGDENQLMFHTHGQFGQKESLATIAISLPGHLSLADFGDPKDPQTKEEFAKKNTIQSFEDWQRAVNKAIDIAAGKGAKVSLVGQSTGGLLALRALNMKPEKVQSVLAIDPAIVIKPALALGACIAKMTMPMAADWGKLPSLVLGTEVPNVNLGFGCEVEKLSRKFRRELALQYKISEENFGLIYSEFGKSYGGRIKVVGTKSDEVVEPSWIRHLGKVTEGNNFQLMSKTISGTVLSHGTEWVEADIQTKLCLLVSAESYLCYKKSIEKIQKFMSSALLSPILRDAIESKQGIDAPLLRGAEAEYSGNLEFSRESFISSLESTGVTRLQIDKTIGAIAKVQDFYSKWQKLVKKKLPVIAKNFQDFVENDQGLPILDREAQEVPSLILRFPLDLSAHSLQTKQAIEKLSSYCWIKGPRCKIEFPDRMSLRDLGKERGSHKGAMWSDYEALTDFDVLTSRRTRYGLPEISTDEIQGICQFAIDVSPDQCAKSYSAKLRLNLAYRDFFSAKRAALFKEFIGSPSLEQAIQGQEFLHEIQKKIAKATEASPHHRFEPSATTTNGGRQQSLAQ